MPSGMGRRSRRLLLLPPRAHPLVVVAPLLLPLAAAAARLLPALVARLLLLLLPLRARPPLPAHTRAHPPPRLLRDHMRGIRVISTRSMMII